MSSENESPQPHDADLSRLIEVLFPETRFKREATEMSSEELILQLHAAGWRRTVCLDHERKTGAVRMAVKYQEPYDGGFASTDPAACWAYMMSKQHSSGSKTKNELLADLACDLLDSHARIRFFPYLGTKLKNPLLKKSGELVLPANRRITMTLIRRSIRAAVAKDLLYDPDQPLHRELHQLGQVADLEESNQNEILRMIYGWTPPQGE